MNFSAETYAVMEERHRNGSASDHEWRVYQFLWTWSCPRFSGSAGILHDRVWDKLGKTKYYNRINRVRKWIGLNSYIKENRK